MCSCEAFHSHLKIPKSATSVVVDFKASGWTVDARAFVFVTDDLLSFLILIIAKERCCLAEHSSFHKFFRVIETAEILEAMAHVDARVLQTLCHSSVCSSSVS